MSVLDDIYARVTIARKGNHLNRGASPEKHVAAVADVREHRQAPVPSRRSARLLKLGRLAGGVAGGFMAEGVRRLARGEIPRTTDLLLTQGNARRITDRLSELRGAAMKVGQLLSMEAGEILPPELVAALARLRDDAHTMPLGEVAQVLGNAWGRDWDKGFKRFMFTPLAAASIGQVHEAVTRDGRHLAVKIQYPGVRQSIDSDVDNLIGVLSVFGALPGKLDMTQILDETKRQLHLEADYLREAEHLKAYSGRLEGDDRFDVPIVDAGLTTPEVLTMSFLGGTPIDELADEPASVRNAIAASLIDLSLEEFFVWGLVQTDANIANYVYDRATARIGLLDFGATRRYGCRQIGVFRNLLAAAMDHDRERLDAAAAAAGYLTDEDTASYRATVTDLLIDATEPAREEGPYDFGASDLARRMSERVVEMRIDRQMWRMPPADILFLHRKLGGLYLICSRLRARVDVMSRSQALLFRDTKPASMGETAR